MIKLAIIFGSKSSEHEVSCMSAYNIIRKLNNTKYEIYKIGIDKDGTWFNYNGNIESIYKCTWQSDIENKDKILDIIDELKKYDVIFPVLHGKYGEDGTIQGLFELAGVKYVGCKVLGSSIAMDKILSKELVRSIGIDVVEYLTICKEEYDNMDDIVFSKLLGKVDEKLSFPVIVKPNREGSSYGVIKVNSKEELKTSIESSLKYDDSILIERYIGNRQEVECAVLSNKESGKIIASLPGEIVSANELYDYEAKYINNESYVKIPAKISKECMEKIREYSIKVFKKLRLSSLSRIDFFVENGNNIYFNEVNTLPGFTDISMYPMMIEKSGIPYEELLDILIKNELI